MSAILCFHYFNFFFRIRQQKKRRIIKMSSMPTITKFLFLVFIFASKARKWNRKELDKSRKIQIYK